MDRRRLRHPVRRDRRPARRDGRPGRRADRGRVAAAGGPAALPGSRTGGPARPCSPSNPRPPPASLRSLRAGRPVTVDTAGPTIMAGLNCGTVSGIAWPVITAGSTPRVGRRRGPGRGRVAELARHGLRGRPVRRRRAGRRPRRPDRPGAAGGPRPRTPARAWSSSAPRASPPTRSPTSTERPRDHHPTADAGAGPRGGRSDRSTSSAFDSSPSPTLAPLRSRRECDRRLLRRLAEHCGGFTYPSGSRRHTGTGPSISCAPRLRSGWRSVDHAQRPPRHRQPPRATTAIRSTWSSSDGRLHGRGSLRHEGGHRRHAWSAAARAHRQPHRR